MNKILMAVIAFLVSIGVAIATSWINGVNADREIIHQLQFKDAYLVGPVPQAPVAPVTKK